MALVLLTIIPTACAFTCPLCGQSSEAGSGLQPVLAASVIPVCRACVKAQSPELTAVLNLALTAERVAQRGRAQLTLPLATLLDLEAMAQRYWDACHVIPRR